MTLCVYNDVDLENLRIDLENQFHHPRDYAATFHCTVESIRNLCVCLREVRDEIRRRHG